MKTNILTGLASIALLWPLATGCSEETSVVGHDRGRVLPQVDFKSEPLTGSRDIAESRASVDKPITVDDLSLTLSSAEGDFSSTWTPASSFDSSKEFPVGPYTLEAFYGSDTDEGYGKPYYYGKQELEVKTNRTTTVNLTVTLANSIVKVVFTDAFKEYMSAYSATIHSAGNPTPFAYDETSAEELYVRPGEITLNLDITKPNGKSGQIEAAHFTAKPRCRHTVTVDVNEGNVGKLEGLKITFSDNTPEEPVDIDISDDILSASAPVLSLVGVENGAQISSVETVALKGQLSANVVARGKIASVMLTTSGSALLAAGFPAEIDLAHPTDEQKAAMMKLGLNTLGIWNNPDVMGVVDFSRLVPNIPFDAANPVTTFSLSVKDLNGKVSDPMSFSVSIEELRLAIAEGFIIDNGIAEITLDYNGDNIKDAVFELNNNRGRKTILKVDSAVKDEATGMYKITVSHPTDDPVLVATEAAEVRVTIGNKWVEGTIKPIAMVISEDNGVNAFAKKAFVTVSYAEDASLVGGTEFYVSKDGSNFNKIESRQAVRGRTYETKASFEINGLEPATTYTIYAQSGSNKTPRVSFTTEEDLQVPNPGMEEFHTKQGASKHQTWYYPWAEGSANHVWNTYNPVTMSQAANKSQYNYAYDATSGTVFTTDKNSGSHAAQIRTVGWGGGNTASGNAFNRWNFGSCKYVSAGQLFLGNWDGIDPIRNAVPNYGMSFSSRPSSITFFYKYAVMNKDGNDNGQKGVAIIKILSASGQVIAEQEVLIDPNCSYANLNDALDYSVKGSYAQKTIALSYQPNSPKAAQIQIIFKSTQLSSDELEGLKNSSNMRPPKPLNLSDNEYLGSSLLIDDIVLNY